MDHQNAANIGYAFQRCAILMVNDTDIRNRAGVYAALDLMGEFVDIWTEDMPNCTLRLDVRQMEAVIVLIRWAGVNITTRYPDINDDGSNPDMAGLE